MATRTELSTFLADVERRAFKQAVFAVRDDDVALDIVQDSMMRLTESYGDKPSAELPPLFQRILQNAIRDHYRRSRTRMTHIVALSNLGPLDDDSADPLENHVVDAEYNPFASPPDARLRSETLQLVEDALQNLPSRQREAFLLRYWEGLDIAETATAMGCSEGSVKTHCSRATQALSVALKAKGVQL